MMLDGGDPAVVAGDCCSRGRRESFSPVVGVRSRMMAFWIRRGRLRARRRQGGLDGSLRQ